MSGRWISTEVRFWSRVDISGGEDSCWNWTSHLSNGYGRLTVTGRGILPAHRYSYELHNNCEVPVDLVVCHSCDNTACVNPKHLWVGTQSDNLNDMISKKRTKKSAATHCLRGHELTPENVYARQGRKKRNCKICTMIRGKNKRASKLAIMASAENNNKESENV